MPGGSPFGWVLLAFLIASPVLIPLVFLLAFIDWVRGPKESNNH